MNIHEVRNLFKSITNEYMVVAKLRYTPIKLYWWLKSERINRLKEIMGNKWWNDGHYIYSEAVWQFSSSDNDGRHYVKYLSEKRQVIHQERYLPQGGTIDDVQISTSMVDLTCNSVEALVVVCQELLDCALDFGINPKKIKIWDSQLNEYLSSPRFYVAH